MSEAELGRKIDARGNSDHLNATNLSFGDHLNIKQRKSAGDQPGDLSRKVKFEPYKEQFSRRKL
jgi:hypothetical protein